MHSIPGEACGNGAAVARVYAERYPQHRLLNPCTFNATDHRISETNTVPPSTMEDRNA
jgi:hypothetical protein